MAFAAWFQGRAAPEHADALKAALVTLARESRQQAGTLRYDFYIPEEDPLSIILLAIWEDEADWRAHVASDVHRRYTESLPSGAWTSRPSMTRVRVLDETG